jgi:hypothetical protein
MSLGRPTGGRLQRRKPGENGGLALGAIAEIEHPTRAKQPSTARARWDASLVSARQRRAREPHIIAMIRLSGHSGFESHLRELDGFGDLLPRREGRHS